MIKKLYILLVTVFFSVHCGVILASVKITGVSEDAVRENIELVVNSKYTQCFEKNVNLIVVKKDIQRLVSKATEPYGFYSPSIDLDVDFDGLKCVEPIVKVDLGEPIVICSLAINIIGDGADTEPFKAVIAKFPLTVGSILVDSHYSELKSRLEYVASEYGYLDAVFKEKKLLVSKQSKSAEVVLVFDTGKRYIISDIDIQAPEDFLSSNFLLGLMPLEKGEYFTRSQIYRLRKRLLDTSYFSKVSVRIDKPKRSNGRAVVRVVLTPKNKEQYTAGLGFSTDTGARVRLDYKNNWLNSSGYQIFSKSSFSTVTKALSAGMYIPSTKAPSREFFSIDIGVKDEKTDFTESQSTKVGLSHVLNDENGWKSIRFVDVVYDEFELEGSRDRSLIVVPGINWNYLDTNNVVMPDSGFHFQAEIKGATKAVFSDVDFLQLSAKYKGISTLVPKHRLLYRLHLGTTITDNLEGLPIDYRYYAGGDNSVRGFSYRAISPQNANGDFVGGKHLITASLEYDYRFSQQWAIAVFSDTGSAFNRKVDFQSSLGLGLRWISPLGPIRLDIAKPVNGDNGSIRVHIRLGPDL